MLNHMVVDSSLTTFHDSVEKLYREQPKNIFASIYCRIIDWITGGDYNQKLNQQIVDITAQAEKILKALPKDMQTPESLRNMQGSKAQQQFCDDMDRLFKEIYPLTDSSPFSATNKMPKLVQEYLSADIRNLRKEKALDPAKVMDDAHKTERKIAKGKLAIAIGHGIKQNTGSTGTLIILDVNGKPVGIHKISKKDVPLTTRIRHLFRLLIGGQMSCLSNSDLAQPMSEKAAYIVSNGLGFNLAPPSKKETLKGYAGVFQVFINKEKSQGVSADIKEAKNIIAVRAISPNHYRQAVDIFPELEAKEVFTEKEKTLFQKLAIFDYLIGNLDRHEENWLVTFSDDNEITSIKAIDNANAFPKIQPEKGKTASKHQYEWKSLKIAGEQFTPEAVEFVRNAITFNNLQKIVQEIQKNCDNFLDEDMKLLLYTRQKAIYRLVCEESGKTPAGLASYSTEDEMLALCHPKNAF